MSDRVREPLLRKPKKLIVCCDGTWMDSDSGWVKGGWFGGDGHLQTPSNVTRIARGIPCEDSKGSPQIVYYQAGVGTGIGLTNQVLGGGTGLGLAEHIREAYSFLANNYGGGDLIYLIGFSRGAFTARSLAGLIGQLGLLNKRGLEHFYEIFEDWEHAGDPEYDGPIFLKNYQDDDTGTKYTLQTPANDPDRAVEYLREYRALLRSLDLMHRAPARANDGSEEIRIQAVACWDTVGALGIPINPALQRWFRLPAFFQVKHLKWMDTTLTDNIVNAFHALALDEHRAPFSPAVWEKPKGCETNLKQVWFPGAHSGVGGGYDDAGSANISLAWMMDQLAGHSSSTTSRQSDQWIEFDEDYLPYLHRLNRDWYQSNPPKFSWANGALIRSFGFPMSLAGYINRTPGRYRKVDGITMKMQDHVLLRDTNEFIHASVRARMELGGTAPIDDNRTWHLFSALVRLINRMLGRGAKAIYHPSSLRGWRLQDGHKYHDAVALNGCKIVQDSGMTPWWEWRGHDRDVLPGKKLLEDKLGEFERVLLRDAKAGPEIEASNLGLTSVESLRRRHIEIVEEARRSATI